MKRLIALALLLAMVMPGGLALASDISGALYKMSITITNSGAAATNVSTNVAISTTNLVAGGFASDAVTNVAMRNAAGADVPFMPGYGSNPWAMFVPSIGANAQLNYSLYTSNSSAGSLRYFPGNTGMTTSDTASMEFGNNFITEDKGFFDTSSSGVGAHIEKKQDAYRVYVSATDTITADFYASSGSITPYSSTSDGHVMNTGTSGTVDITPNGAGDYTNVGSAVPAVTHYENVDDPPGSPDDDTTYVQNNGATDEADVYNLTDPSIPSGATIDSVIVYIRCIGRATLNTNAYGRVRLSGSETTSGAHLLTAGYQTFSDSLSRPGGGSWSPSDMASLQAGVRLASGSGGAGACTQVYVHVTYTVTYSNLRSASTGSSISAGAATFNVGQQLTGSTYSIWRGALYFDTSLIPDIASITSATLKLYGQTDASTTDFNVVVLSGQPTYPHDPLVVGDYGISQYTAGDGGSSISTSTFTTSGYNVIALNAISRGWINKTGTTKLLVASSRDLSATAPAGDEYVSFQTTETAGTDKDPHLDITYECDVSATVTPGEHTIRVGLSSGTLSLYVDNMVTPADTAALPGFTVTDNANPLIVAEPAAVPYLEYHKTTVGGTLKQHIIWQHWVITGSTLTNGTGIATGSPVSLAYGSNTITVTQVGTFTAALPTGLNGTATSGTTTVTGSPQALVEGNNTVTTTTATGTFTINLFPIFRDQSGNNNHATPSFRTTSSNANVSAAAVSFQPITEAKAPAWSLGTSSAWLIEVPPITGNFTSTNVTSTFPGASVVAALAAASSTPAELPLNLIGGFVILALSFSVSAVMRKHAAGSMLVKGFLIACLMGIAVATKTYDFWMIVVFAFLGIALAMASTDPRWG